MGFGDPAITRPVGQTGRTDRSVRRSERVNAHLALNKQGFVAAAVAALTTYRKRLSAEA